jgi:hypothetical protein
MLYLKKAQALSSLKSFHSSQKWGVEVKKNDLFKSFEIEVLCDIMNWLKYLLAEQRLQIKLSRIK